ncbi:hypothetical protein VFPPC_17084 [Pochonia chlamydosporia 170]|uniref:Uncharacterized protein n=1 Tax=Pochonia chlamydosporia 170 TaxID=1380566 RepID=A0A179EXD3_METCM|nr:hypothetical protein VFPPC_17084 [Pochonia chlamydosporia 170]OAQ57828.2 hypothetical protein VFPPC_17084 [Pochonia chlamydosporia 170]
MQRHQIGGRSNRAPRSGIKNQIIYISEVRCAFYGNSTGRGIWLVVEPNAKQHSNIQRLGLNVKKLEESAYDAVSPFFTDNEAIAKKRPYLSEIFKLARQEERFKSGEIGECKLADESTEIDVIAKDTATGIDVSEDGDALFANDDDGGEYGNVLTSATQLPEVPMPLTRAPTQIFGEGPDKDEPCIQETSFNSDFFSPGMLRTDMSSQPYPIVTSGLAFIDQDTVTASNAALTLDVAPNPCDNNRPPSLSDKYICPSGGSQFNQLWQLAGQVGPTQSGMYAYASTEANCWLQGS